MTLALAALSGCGRNEPSPPETPPQPAEVAADPRVLPHYSFAPGLEDRFPQVSRFVRQFLETCLAGDYAGYRLLVSRTQTPQSRERFGAIYDSIRSVVVESIEPLELAEIRPPTYRIVSGVELSPEGEGTFDPRTRKIAIIVLQEDGQWRMLPAPSEMQPPRESATAASKPAYPLPDYPWDQDVDY